jgi:hypothetical protein
MSLCHKAVEGIVSTGAERNSLWNWVTYHVQDEKSKLSEHQSVFQRSEGLWRVNYDMLPEKSQRQSRIICQLESSHQSISRNLHVNNLHPFEKTKFLYLNFRSHVTMLSHLASLNRECVCTDRHGNIAQYEDKTKSRGTKYFHFS